MQQSLLPVLFCFNIVIAAAQTHELVLEPQIVGASLESCDMGPPKASIYTYVETYYAYDFNKPADGNRPGFFYAYNRHNEVNIHLGLIKAQYESNYIRANVGIGLGTYMNANYAAEPGGLKYVQEMNAGLRLSQKHDLWIDVGVMGSHIGFESAIGKDCQTLTRSIMAENSPYFETGAKITYKSDNEKWLLSGLLLNGWQRIQRAPGTSLPAFGTQIQFSPNENILLNSSTFIGSDQPDTSRQMRYFHDLYGVFQLGEKWNLTLGFDIGWQQSAPESSRYHKWYTPVMILSFKPNNKWAFAGRVEWYRDQAGVMIESIAPDGANIRGYSVNVDYHIFSNAVWRIEGRLLQSPYGIFLSGNNTFMPSNALISTSVAVSL